MSSSNEPEQPTSNDAPVSDTANDENVESEFAEADFLADEENTVAAVPVAPVEIKPARQISPQAFKMLGISAIVFCAVIYWLRLNNVVGLFIDDAWYLLLAKALATGQGYNLINSPTPNVLPLYPPGWPFLLSLFFRVYPHFPNNLWLLKFVSIAAMFGTGWFTYLLFYQVRLLPRTLSLLLAVATVLTPGLVYFATETLMSECAYLCLLMATIYLVERNLQAQQFTKYFAVVGALAGYTFLVRSTGLALLVAIGLCLLWGKFLRPLVIFCVLVAAISLPWVIYSRVNTPTAAIQAEQNSYIVQTYGAAFWQRTAGDDESGEIQVSELPERFWNNFLQLSIRDLGRILLGQIVDYFFATEIRARSETGDLQSVNFTASSWFSVILGIFILSGFIFILREKIRVAELFVAGSIFMLLLWPFEIIRFVLPLVPFLLFYLVRGLRPIADLHRRLSGKPNAQPSYLEAYCVIGFILLVSVVGNFLYIYQARLPQQANLMRTTEIFQEQKEVFAFVNESAPKDALLIAANAPLAYMLTDRKTISMGNTAKQWELWKKLGASYMVYTSATPLPPPMEPETRFNILYRSPRMNMRVIDLGPANGRKAWE